MHKTKLYGILFRLTHPAKTQLKKVVGNTVLTFEELTTVMTQIEACLNSRPLYPISNDPLDLNVLTPGHFLVGAPLTSLPQNDLSDINIGRLTRYQLVTQIIQSFWRRWSREYLSQLQQRPKWQRSYTSDIKIGSLVLLVEDNTAPLHWRMGRVVDVYKGNDNVVRVVSVKTTSNVIKRSIKRVCLLPVAAENA